MIRSLLAPLALAPVLLAAQDVHMNAVIEPAGAPTICPGYQYVVQGGHVLLDTSVFDVSSYVGQILHVDGVDVTGGCSLPIVQVTSVALPTATLEVCGTFHAGCPMRFRVGPPTISLNYLAVSFADPVFANLGDPLGVLMLGSPLIVLGSTGTGGVFDVDVPGSLAPGVTLHAQGFHLEVGPITGPGALSNAITLHSLSGPFCVDPTTCGF